MMTHEQLVERIVKQVTARLAQADAPTRDTTVLVTDAVITADTLATRLNGQTRIAIAAKSILTPAAKDLLNQHGVSWHRLQNGEAAHSRQTRWLAILLEKNSTSTAAFEQSGNTWNHQLAADNHEATETAVSAVCRAEADGVVVLTSRPASVACRANRNSKLRAVVVSEVNDVSLIQHELGPNLYCINPAQRSFIEMRNLLRVIASDTPQPPADWKDSL